MPATLETSLEELKAERKPLVELFNKNPQRLHLAIKIKGIDDQIAECTEAIRSASQDRAGSRSRFKAEKPR
jgi:hypothetical protein